MKDPKRLVELAKEIEALKEFRVALYKGNFLTLHTGESGKSRKTLEADKWLKDSDIRGELLARLDARMETLKVVTYEVLNDG